MQAIIWSKDNCSFCVRAKHLLTINNIDFEERNMSRGPWTREQLLVVVPDAKAVPQIFIDDQLIGGYTELAEWFDQQ
jgi:glutaredoxin